MAETQMDKAKARWSSTTTALSRMPLWRLAYAVGVALAAAGALAALLLGLARGRGLDAAPVLYGLVLAAIGYVGYAVSKQSVLNGSAVAAVAGVGLILLGGVMPLLGGLLLLLGAVWAMATSRPHAAPQGLGPGTS